MNSRPRWLANAGTAQNERLPRALDPTNPRYFRVDERRLSDLVDESATGASQLVFPDLENREAGRWDRWFDTDDALVLARIVSVDVERLRAEFLRTLDEGAPELLTLRILALARRIHDWYGSLAVVDRPACIAMCEHIRRLTSERLADLLAWTLAQAPADPSIRRFGARVASDKLWKPSGKVPASLAANNGRSGTRVVFFTFLDAIAQLRARALEDLPVSLAGNAHEPSAALFLSFLQLYGTVQQQLNEFTARHADFYYHDCLRMAPRPAIPDSVHLVCRRVPGIEGPVHLPAGTPVSVDKDSDGRDFIYRVVDGVQLTDATVEALCTLRFERDPLISPEREMAYVTRAKAQRLPQASGASRAQPRHWPLFGGTARRADEHSADDAELGLAFASPLLLLAEGEREVRIALEFSQMADRDLGAAEALARFTKEGPASRAATNDADRTPRSLLELLEQLFPRFAGILPAPPAKAGAADIAQPPAADAAASEPDAVRRLAQGAAQRVAARVLLSRIAALSNDEAAMLHQQIASAPERIVVRSRAVLPARLRAGLRHALAQRLGHLPARGSRRRLDLQFEIATDPGTELQLLVDGRDALPGGSGAQRAAYTLPMLHGAYLLQRLLDSRSQAAFFGHFGRLFCRWMLIDPDLLGAEEIRAIKASLRGVPRPDEPPRHERQRKHGAWQDPDRADVLACLRGRKRPVRDYLFNKFFLNLTGVQLTGSDGWFAPADSFVLGADLDAGAAEQSDLSVVLRLRPDAPAVVPYAPALHGEGLRTTLPVVRLRLRQGSSLFPYSALSDLVLSTARIDVSVSGVRDLVLHNNFGRLDPSKAFNPFGPLPGRGSYLVLGSAEIARKPITDLRVNVEWGQLPEDDGGFASHYRGYTGDFGNQSVRAGVAILRDGRWEPRGGASELPLFGAGADAGRVPRETALEVPAMDLRNHYRPSRAMDEGEEFRFDLGVRSGFFRIELAEPADPFGHKEYPVLLTRVVSANAKRRRPLAMPNAPYTPLIERISVDYRASGVMNLAHEIPEERVGTEDQVFLIHPFGFEEVYPAIRGVPAGPIPAYDEDGNLFIGLRAGTLGGPLSLMFHLRDESARRHVDRRARARFTWSYLASNRWHPLAPSCVVSDTTHGFLTSGIVLLDIPEEIDRNNTILPADLFWLRLSTSDGVDSVAGLYGVYAQAVRATRDSATEAGVVAASADEMPRDGSVARPGVSVPGLASAEQVGGPFGGRAAETASQLRCRTGERLRHRNRASVYWDYERLVLDAFPKVFKVKCFASMAGATSGPRPGAVLLVVIPHPEPGGASHTQAPKMNATELESIRAHVVARASAFADIVVRNPTYERIQVHCAVRFRAGMQSGLHLQRLNADLIERLSPWRGDGAGAQFDWTLRKEDVEAWIRDLDYVSSVARVSLVQVAEADTGDFWLGDSARRTRDMTATGLWTGRPTEAPPGAVRPRFPWSIALPAHHHALEPMSDATRGEAAETGIARLEIGNTFIVVGARDG